MSIAGVEIRLMFLPCSRLLTIHKQTAALLIALPPTALALGAGYLGARRGLTGVAVGVAAACFVEFVCINAYAFAQFDDWRAVVRRIAGISATAMAVLFLVWAIERLIPEGPPLLAAVGGWRLAAVAMVALPLMLRAARRLRGGAAPDLVDFS